MEKDISVIYINIYIYIYIGGYYIYVEDTYLTYVYLCLWKKKYIHKLKTYICEV